MQGEGPRTCSASSGRNDGRDFNRIYQTLASGGLAPGDFAEIIGDRKRGGGGEIGIAHAIAGQPVSRCDQMLDIMEMRADIGARGPEQRRIGRAAIAAGFGALPLDEFLLDQIRGDLVIELATRTIR